VNSSTAIHHPSIHIKKKLVKILAWSNVTTLHIPVHAVDCYQKKECALSLIYVVFYLHVLGFSADVGQSKKFQHMQMVIYTYFLEPWFFKSDKINRFSNPVVVFFHF